MLLGNESWSRFSNSVNVFTIFVASAESGADDPNASIVRDTYFSSSFNTGGIDRLLAIASGSQGTGKALALLTQFVPDWDVVIVLVNSTKYGGSGGTFMTAALNTSSDEIMLHELGHSFARLTDEYVDAAAAPSYPPAEYPNATVETARERISWRAFILPATPIPTASAPDENTVGLFAGADYRDNYYRPTFNSKMRALGRPFGPVNLRGYAAAVHRFNLNLAATPPAIVQQPAGASVTAGQAYTLHVTASGAGPLTYQWRLNGVYLATGNGADFPIAAMSASQAGLYAVEVTNAVGMTASAEVAVLLPGTAVPTIGTLSPSTAVAAGQSVNLAAIADGTAPLSYQWRKDGTAISSATTGTLTLGAVESADAGAYTIVVTNAFSSTTSVPAIVGVSSGSKVIGAGTEILSNQFVAFNNNTFDQVALQGAAATITADPLQITRMSFVDLNDDIVQVEFSGAGSLSLVLDAVSGPAAPVKYNQAGVTYMKGHAGIVITGADETTNVSVFSVGKITAVNQALFINGVTYDGVADLAYIAILSTNGKFGGVRTADASYFATKGYTGIYAPGVTFTGPVYVGDISASDTATPVLLLGGATNNTWVAGGDLLQTNGQPVKVSGITQLKFMAGTDSHGNLLSAKANRASLQQNGTDVTAQIVVNP